MTTIAPLPNTTRRSDDFPSLYRHGLAKHTKGDAAGGDADIAVRSVRAGTRDGQQCRRFADSPLSR
jgi:hypothetical protein